MALVRADFGRLEDLRKRAAEVASAGFREQLAQRLGVTAVKLLADEFRESKDPYGRGWLPVYRNRLRERRARARALKQGNWQRAQRRDKPLVDTGRLRAAATAPAHVSGALVTVSIPVDYASYHQEGTRHIVRRQIVPDAAGGLGPIWEEAFRKETERAVIETMKGGG